MEAYAPAPTPRTKLPPQTVGLITSPIVAFILLVINKIWDPIYDCYGFLLDSGRHMEDYEHAVRRVVAMRSDFILSDPSPSSDQAVKWLKRAELLQKEEETIKKCYKESGSFKRWYYLRQAIKETKRAEDIASQYKEILVESKPRPRPVSGLSSGDPLLILEPYKEMIIAFIKNTSEDSKLLGIWGMPGVGKSVLLRQISMCRSQYAAADSSFQILYIDASLDCSIAKLQKSLLGLMGLAPTPDITEAAQAFSIASYLCGKNFLLLIDGVREPFNIARIGIPDPAVAPAMRRKVVFTARTHSICASMGSNRIIQMLCPKESDALELFKRAVGDKALKDARVSALASVVIKECGMLPEALWNVGLSMSIKEDPEQWELAIKLLRQANLHLVTHKKDNLLERLRCSYDDLEDNIKECLLLICSLCSEDANISIDSIILWWRGMGLLDYLNAHIDGYAYIKMLQQHYLLEKGQNTLTSNENSHVRMNPMIRKALMKASNNRDANWFPDSSWRSSLTDKMWLSAEHVWASSKDFEMFKKYSYLENRKSLQSHLKVLVSRCLIKFDRCTFDQLVFLDMEGVTISNFPLRVCLMNTLEYLNMSSTGISSAPSNLGQLSRLKYLILRRNPDLEHIPAGVIGKMQELKVLDLFDTGCLLNTALINEMKEAEMDHLVAGFTVVAENGLSELRELSQVCPMYMCLSGIETEKVGLLHLLTNFDRIHELEIRTSDSVLKIVYTDLVLENTPKIFKFLQKFEISNMPNLESVDLGPEGLSIKSVTITDCSKLTDLTWIVSLVNLEVLTVKDCRMLRTLISATVTEELGLPRLKRVQLHNLPELLILPKLKGLIHYCVFQCRKLSGFPNLQSEERVLIDCDADIWNMIVRTGMADQFTQRVRH